MYWSEGKSGGTARGEAVDDYFTTAQATDFKHVEYRHTEEINNEHGRLEIRCYWITEDLCTLPHTELWKGLRSVERRYFINSIAADASQSPMRCADIGASRTAYIGEWT